MKNIENQFDASKRKSETLRTKLHESDKKTVKLESQLNTSLLKGKLLEEQVELLEKDLKNQNNGTSDNLNDAIEERNVAIKEKNEAWIELSVVKGELIQTNQQLLEVVFKSSEK